MSYKTPETKSNSYKQEQQHLNNTSVKSQQATVCPVIAVKALSVSQRIPTAKMDSGVSMYLFYSLMYGFFCLCFVAPPTEFVSAGLTVQHIFSSFLGSEEMTFIEFHIKKTTVTAFVHSLLPLGKYTEVHKHKHGGDIARITHTSTHARNMTNWL